MSPPALLTFYLPRLIMLLCTLLLLDNANQVITFRSKPTQMTALLDEDYQHSPVRISRQVLEHDFRRIIQSKWLGIHVWPVLPWLILAFIQFSSTIRKRFIALHRWAGRLFTSISLLMTFAYLMMFVDREVMLGDDEFYIDFAKPQKFFTFRSATLFFTLWWLYCLLQTYRKAAMRTIQLHRYYATHFAATGFAVGVFRIFIAIFLVSYYPSSGPDEMQKPTQDLLFGYGLWAAFTLSILSVEVYYRLGWLGPTSPPSTNDAKSR